MFRDRQFYSSALPESREFSPQRRVLCDRARVFRGVRGTPTTMRRTAWAISRIQDTREVSARPHRHRRRSRIRLEERRGRGGGGRNAHVPGPPAALPARRGEHPRDWRHGCTSSRRRLKASRTCVQLVVAKRKDTESLEICREHNMEGWKFSGGAVHPGPSISTFSHIASRDQLQYTELRIQESLRGPSEKL